MRTTPPAATGAAAARRAAAGVPQAVSSRDVLALQRSAGNRRAASALGVNAGPLAVPQIGRTRASRVQRVTFREMFLEYRDDLTQLGAFARWLSARAGNDDADRDELLSIMSKQEVTGSIALFLEHEEEQAEVGSISFEDIATGRARVPETPGKQIDTLMMSSPHIGEIAVRKYAEGVKVEGAVEVLGDAEFQRKHWESFYALNRRLLEGQTDDVIWHFQLRDASKIDRVDGFQSDLDGKIYMRPGRLGFRVAVHEAVHKYGGHDFESAFGHPFNEGATDYIAMMVCAQIGAEISPQYYPGEKRLLADVLQVLGVSDEQLFDAYLNDNVVPILGRLLERIGPEGVEAFKTAKNVPDATTAFNEGQRRARDER